MDVLEYIIKTMVEAAPKNPGLQTPPFYPILNLFLPLGLGIVLVWITRFIEKGLTRLLREKR